MAAKTTDWRPGPTVCRCCLSEGCYKDISTEYFWMGKREVYSEMLSDTFSLSIAYSTSGGPNSNSRLICEPCISRLRDASEFKRQVQECEKTFMQYLDPGSEPLSDFDDAVRVEAPMGAIDTQVKVEPVKLEKDEDSDAGDFEGRADFLDDDDDDLDDQPLTRLATKVPKKESVDLLELLDTGKTAEKRKSSTKAKAGPAKKAKTKKEVVKATSSKATKQTDKKKKGDDNTATNTNDKVINARYKAKKASDLECVKRKKIGRNGTVALITNSNALPFKWWNNHFLCFYCEEKFIDFCKLEQHNTTEHQLTEKQIVKSLVRLGRYQKVKVNFTNFICKVCSHESEDYNRLKDHLASNHQVKLDVNNDGVFPYRIDSERYNCAMCPQSFHNYRLLNRHINIHFPNFVCEQCGVGFATDERLKAHTQSHLSGSHKCDLCDKVFRRISAKKDHIERIHMKVKKHRCPYCKEMFKEYGQRIKHMVRVHGVKVPEFRCTMCPKVYMFSGQLRVHERVAHFKTRKYECSICQKTCSNASVLRDHMVCHSGERNYECQVCKKKYGRKKTLVEHMRIHNNDRRFVCQYCNSAFVQNCSLKSHVRTHHRNEIKVE